MAAPISNTEDEKCKNAISMVRDALKQLNYTDDNKEIRSYHENSYSYALEMRHNFSGKKITLLVQGSYANKTNIPTESDVDVAVILESTFSPQYRQGVTGANYGFSEGTFSVKDLKDEVHNALNKHFGYQGVERHDKSIKVIGNTYRVDADVVPAYRYRDYTNDYWNNPDNYIGGIEIRPDRGGRIINFPEQHIKNGVLKNKDTDYNFKKCVRIMKSMKENMEDEGYIISDKISSFGLESLLWNIDSSVYKKYSNLLYVFDDVVLYLLADFSNFYKYKEANGIKKLFEDHTTETAYKDFINDLQKHFQWSIKK